jgi:hypothetical protein
VARALRLIHELPAELAEFCENFEADLNFIPAFFLEQSSGRTES